jgi:FKBP-type peptidyl-prolyl cis-trans isomerase FklB
MKKLIAVALVLSLCAGTGIAQKKGTPKTKKDKVSYSIGINLGKNFKMQGLDIDQAFFMQGIKDALGNSKTAMSEKDMENHSSLLIKRKKGLSSYRADCSTKF